MRVITEKRICEAKEKWPRPASALDAWYRLVKTCRPTDFAAMRAIFPSIDKVGPLHVFDIGGNKIRLIAWVSYSAQRIYIKHVLDHSEYDKGKWKD